MSRLLRMDAVAERLDVTTWRAYELGREGLLPVVRLGRSMRVDEDTLDAWIKAGGSTSANTQSREEIAH